MIGVGGSGVLGAYGQYLAGLELFDQAAAAGCPATVDVIVVPSATGGTQAGLIAACADRSPRTRVAGMVVARSAAELRPVIASMVGDLESLADGGTVPTRPRPTPSRAIDLDEGQLGDGYGRPTPAAAEASALLARTEGILTDPIYTAKALAGLVARSVPAPGTASASCSGTPAACPGSSSRSTDPPAARPSLPGGAPRVAELHPARGLEHGPRVDPRPDREQDPDADHGDRDRQEDLQRPDGIERGPHRDHERGRRRQVRRHLRDGCRTDR